MRCGSSYLAGLFDEHPQVTMAKPFIINEPKYFLSPNSEKNGYDSYFDAYFSDAPEASILGEKSVSYLETKEAAERINSLIPEAKIIIVLRDPVRRAISHYYYSRKNNLEKRDFDKAFLTLEDLEPSPEFSKISMPPFSYLNRGLYQKNIEYYQSIFGQKNVHIIILENLVSGMDGGLSKMYEFVGADPDFSPSGFEIMTNQSTPKNYSPPEETLERLRSYFRKPNDALSQSFGLDISQWDNS